MTAKNLLLLTMYKHSNHSVFLIQYHIIWCPKFRYNVLHPPVDDRLKEMIADVCNEYKFEVKALEIMPDHVHLFVSTPQTIAPSSVVQIIKSKTAIRLFSEFPNLKKFYSRCGALWSRGYFISTIGHVSEQVIKRYIADQKKKEV